MRRLFRKLKETGKLVNIFLLIAATFVYAMFQGGFVSWFLFYSFIPFGLYSFVLSIYPLKDFKLNRHINQTEYVAGEKFEATIVIRRKIPFPLMYVIVEELLPAQLKKYEQSKQSKVILFPWFKRELTYKYVFNAIPRGEHFLEGIRFKTGDLFGLIEKETIAPVRDQFIVYPQYVDMVYRQLESRFEQGMTSSNVRLQRDTAIAIGVRDYTPGDRFSWIDWKASARRNNIMTKEFEQQQSHDVILFMDRTKSAHFEQVVTFTASLTKAILRKGAQISFISIGEDQAIFPLKDGESQQQVIYHHLAKVKDNSPIPFSQIVESEIKKIYQPVTFMLVTSELSQDTIQLAGRFSTRNADLQIFVIKEKGTQLTQAEMGILGAIRKHNVFAKVIYEGQFADVFYEVSRS
ncbi:DUF58 domain-containing protein [Bacillus sp. REN16]|uniref:DUF58 domain-containing protein n=1 Tax=Bacillus sp. REN16 TaxID=2887296 RepID=UPI001E3A0290|nr:DUF58 domain-containing protein [Bacillus sp. REN16]MCC3359446.1 DUF58 domain-containing protein [Bacillus sp. REN16]